MLTKALESQFGPSAFDSPRSNLFKLVQTGSVHQYYMEFSALANRTYGVSTEAILDYFVGGLRPEIRREVIAQNPLNLVRAFALAKLFEDKHEFRPKTTPWYPCSHYSSKPPLNSTQSTVSPHLKPPPLLPFPHSKSLPLQQNSSNIRKMSQAEIQRRRENGLCFTCDEKYFFGHKCPNKQLLLPQVDDQVEEASPPTVPTDDCAEESLTPVSDAKYQPHLSFNALHGAAGAATMQFEGTINGITVQILLDSGSSDGFMQPRIAQFLKLPVPKSPQFQVMVGNGNKLSTEGFIPKLPLSIQGHDLLVSVYLLPVAGIDVVLGASWLKALRSHAANYVDMLFHFYWNGDLVTLQGLSEAAPAPAQFHHFRRLTSTDAIAELYTLEVH